MGKSSNTFGWARAAVISYLVVLVSVAVTHLAGLWAYHSQSGAGEASEASEAGEVGEAATEAKEEPLRGTSVVSSESSPIVTQDGYVVFPKCALWAADGYDLYYSPVDPQTICVLPPGSSAEPGPPPTARSEQEETPPFCAAAPDSAVYCLIGGRLTEQDLRTLYDRGALETPKASGGGDKG